MKTKAERNADAIERNTYAQGLAEGCGTAFAHTYGDVADAVLILAFARGVRAARGRASLFSVNLVEGVAE